jgi:hypothetical protein
VRRRYATFRVGADDDEQRREPLNDAVQLFIAEPIIHGRERNARERGAEQREGQRLGIHVEQRDVLHAAFRDATSGSLCAVEQRAGGERTAGAAHDDAVRCAVRCHLEEQAEVHGAGVSVGRGQWLGALDLEHRVADRQRALARLRAQQLDAEVVVGVSLADLGAAVETGHDRGGGRVSVGREHRLAAAAEVDVASRRFDDDDLGSVGRAAQAGARLLLHRTRSLLTGRRATKTYS